MLVCGLRLPHAAREYGGAGALAEREVSIMAKEKKVEQITDMEVDFAQW